MLLIPTSYYFDPLNQHKYALLLRVFVEINFSNSLAMPPATRVLQAFFVIVNDTGIVMVAWCCDWITFVIKF